MSLTEFVLDARVSTSEEAPVAKDLLDEEELRLDEAELQQDV